MTNTEKKQQAKFTDMIKPAIQLIGILCIVGAMIGIPLGVIIFCARLIGGLY